jgi:hypothetical protein
MLAPNLQASLQENGILSTQLKILDRHRPMLTDQNQTLQRTELKESGQRLTGIVLGGGIDPETDKPYLLLEATDGKAHFLLQSPKIEAGRLQDQLKDRTVITIEVKQFTRYENQQPKIITYQHITEYGSKKDAMNNHALLDKEILTGLSRQQLPVCVSGITGFAHNFHEALSKRCDLLEARGMMMRMGDNVYITNKWATDYAAFRADEIKQEKHIAAELKPWDKSTIIGNVVHSESSLLIMQDTTGNYLYLSSQTERFTNIEQGSTLLIEPTNRHKEGATLIPIDFATLTNEAKLEKLTVTDTLLVHYEEKYRKCRHCLPLPHYWKPALSYGILAVSIVNTGIF